MRWIAMILTAAFVAASVGSASGQQTGCAGQNGKTPLRQAAPSSLDGAPCYSPPGYALAPGCCEFSRRCCDNAWAGYCEHRARVESFWARVGVPKARRCRLVSQPAASVAPCPESATPAIRPAPDSTSASASAVARPKPAVRSARASSIVQPRATEKMPYNESTVPLWEWRF
jgi:hypothetical protein